MKGMASINDYAQSMFRFEYLNDEWIDYCADYLRTVFRDSPRLPAISFFDRPACQWVKISQISITSNVLLAIGPSRLKDEGNDPHLPTTRPTRHARPDHGQ